MDADNRRSSEFCMDISEAIGILGEWKGEDKVGRAKIDRFVSILNADPDDSKMQGTVSYPLTEILELSFLAILGGAETFEDILLIYKYKAKYFRKFLSQKVGFPASDIFYRVFSLIDMGQFDEALTSIIAESLDDLRKARSIPKPKNPLDADDRQAMQAGEQDNLEQTLQNLHVCAIYNGIGFKPSQTEKKSNKIPTVQETLATLDLRKTMVVFDAMETHTELLASIIAMGGHYLVRVEEDQKGLFKACSSYFTPEYLMKAESDPNRYSMLMERNQEKVEECICTVAKVKTHDSTAFALCPGVKAVVRFDKKAENKTTAEKTDETMYFITSLDNNAQACRKAIEEHWHDEELVYSVDMMMFYDDKANLMVNKRVIDNFAVMKRMAQSLYKMVKSLKEVDTVSSIKNRFVWGYEEIMDTMLRSVDSRTIQEALLCSLKKKRPYS